MSIPESIGIVPVEFLETLASLWDEEDTREARRIGRAVDWTPPADLDRASVASRARAYLARVTPAVSGQGGHNQTYHAACVLLLRFAMTPEEAYTLMEEWNQKCSPPWEPDELWRKIREVDTKEAGPRGEYLRPLIREGLRTKRAVEIAARNSRIAGNGGAGAAAAGITATTATAATTAATAAPRADSPANASNGQGGTPGVNGAAGGGTGSPGASGSPPAPPVPPSGNGGVTVGASVASILFTNFHREAVPSGDGTRIREVDIGYPLQHIAGQLASFSGGWPKRIGGQLIAEHNCKPHWIRSASSLFPWIAARLPNGTDANGILWAHGHDKPTKEEFYNYLLQTAEESHALEIYPHEPPMPKHCYIHEPLPEPNQAALEELLDRFTPASDIDRQLIIAFLLTLVWGGKCGQRPAWLFTTDGGVSTGCGAGKSTVAHKGSRLVGNYISASDNDTMKTLQERIFSDIGLSSRVILLDNVKSLRFSWGELEAMITCPILSGRQMYVGEGRRPNNLVVVITLNGASLSKDMAKRTVVVKVKPAKFTSTWDMETDSLIDKHRWGIISALIERLRGQRTPIDVRSRWGQWEGEVLSLLDDPRGCQDVISQRAEEVDNDQEEASTIREEFIRQIQNGDWEDPEEAYIFFPSSVAADIINTAMGEKRPVNKAMGLLRMLGIKELANYRSGTKGRGCTWKGEQSVHKHPRLFGKDERYKGSEISDDLSDLE